MERGHPPPLGGEGNLVAPGLLLVERGLIESGLFRRDDECALGGITFNAPAPSFVEQHPGV